jgi:type I restriction enzyme M protein
VRKNLLKECEVPHAPAPAHRHLLRPGREGQRAVLRPQARRQGALDQDGLGLRPAFTYEEVLARDKGQPRPVLALRDESLEDSASLPEPHLLAQEIADDLRSALEQIEDVLGDLERRADSGAA